VSVSIKYKGRFGNHLFQYIAARLFAEENGLRLKTDFDDNDLVRMDPQEGGDEVGGPEIVLNDFVDIFGKTWPKGRYVFDGFFQNADWFYTKRDKILKFAHIEPVAQWDARDIVMNVRLGDFKAMGWVIDPSWYLEVLSCEAFRKLHIITDEYDTEYLSNFEKFSPVIVSSGKRGDWNYLRSFDRVISSNSTFCWWAMFFSLPGKLYVFKRWVGLPGNNLSIPNSIEIDGKFLREVVPQ
jgi:hypothetical protein